MSRHSTFRIGGPADVLLLPEEEDDLLFGQRLARELEQRLTVLGACSNLLVRDGGIRGIVLRTARSWERVRVEGNLVTASAGTRLPLVAAEARRAGLSGLEFCGVIPGTVGGAVVQNAGAGRQTMADTFRRARVMDSDGATHEVGAGEMEFGHRTTALRDKDLVVVEAGFEGRPEAQEVVARRMAEHRRRRRERLPLSRPSAGSVFRQVSGEEPPVGALIERAGCKGWRCGGAVVSPKHANFILNEGGATAAEVLTLIERIRDAVKQQSGIALELEICVVGEGDKQDAEGVCDG